MIVVNTTFADMVHDERWHKIMGWTFVREALSAKKEILVPANVGGNHWIVFRIDPKARVIEILDSLSAVDPSNDAIELGTKLIHFFVHYELILTRKMVCARYKIARDRWVKKLTKSFSIIMRRKHRGHFTANRLLNRKTCMIAGSSQFITWNVSSKKPRSTFVRTKPRG